MGKDLRVAVCLDDGGGMLFAGRRQSRDRDLISELCEATDGEIFITDFSSFIFREHQGKTVITKNPFEDAPDGATLFIENLPISPYEDLIDELILYKWNRAYPADSKIDIDLTKYKVVAKKEFPGSSHEKITKLRLKK